MKSVIKNLILVVLIFAVSSCGENNANKDNSEIQIENKTNSNSHKDADKKPVPQTKVTTQAEGEVRLSESQSITSNSAAKKESFADASSGIQKTKAYRSAPPILGRTMPAPQYHENIVDRENYNHFDENPLKLVSEDPVSTFSIDVDTGAYSVVRRFLQQGRMPNKDAVRAEELINYFSYGYPIPEDKNMPFGVTTEIAPTPWNKNTLLLHVGIKAYDIPKEQLPPANLVFLCDVSGSMNSPQKLGLLKTSLKMLTSQMSEKDKISLVVYAGASGVVLEPTAGNDYATISMALEQLQAGGSTNGGAGINLAYLMAEKGFIKGGINRVLLATDGDFNVGTTNFEALKQLVERKRKTGISLTTLGFGTGNYNDHLMEQLADVGNGNYAYIDNVNEAQKVLVDNISSTLNTVAKDVKIQIEFNPDNVAEYRLIGYENRQLKREDFNNDKVDAGEIGAGHTVTAIYEITPTDSSEKLVDPLRYGKKEGDKNSAVKTDNNELAFLKIRYKKPDSDKSTLQQWPLNKGMVQKEIESTSNRFRFSAAVAAFAQKLKGGKYTKDFSYENILKLARESKGDDKFGYRGEFITLVNVANSLDREKPLNSDKPLQRK